MHNTQIEQVLECEARLLEAMRCSDAATLDVLLHDDLLFNGPTGETAGKAQDLANYRSGGVKLQSLEASERALASIGDTVVITVTVHIKGDYMGQPLDAPFRYLRIWKHLAGTWKVIGGSVVPLAPSQ